MDNDNRVWIQQLTIQEPYWLFWTKIWYFNYTTNDPYKLFYTNDSCLFWTADNVVKYIQKQKG